MQGAGGDARFPLQHPSGGGGRREAVDPRVPQQPLHFAQHGGLAAAGVTLHADHQVGRRDRAHGSEPMNKLSTATKSRYTSVVKSALRHRHVAVGN